MSPTLSSCQSKMRHQSLYSRSPRRSQTSLRDSTASGPEQQIPDMLCLACCTIQTAYPFQHFLKILAARMRLLCQSLGAVSMKYPSRESCTFLDDFGHVIVSDSSSGHKVVFVFELRSSALVIVVYGSGDSRQVSLDPHHEYWRSSIVVSRRCTYLRFVCG